MTPQNPTAETECWINRLVVGEGLCPFASRPMASGKVRMRTSTAETPAGLYRCLLEELVHYLETPEDKLPTGFVIAPLALHDFGEYNDFLDDVDEALEQVGARGIIQVAGFHPDWQFADAPADDPANHTNRSPYPMFHIIREDMLERMIADFPDPDAIPERNIRHLRDMGIEGIKAVLKDCW